MDSAVLVGIISGGVSLIGSGAATRVAGRRFDHQDRLLDNRFESQQQLRQLVLPSAERFAQAALDSFARLRDLKPPRETEADEGLHRNELVLLDDAERLRRLSACSDAIDAVRHAHASVRLMFKPQGDASRYAWYVLRAQRRMLEAAEIFYGDCCAPDDSERRKRRTRYEPQATQVWTALRDEVGWRAFDQFVATVADDLGNPFGASQQELLSPKDPDDLFNSYKKRRFGAQRSAGEDGSAEVK